MASFARRHRMKWLLRAALVSLLVGVVATLVRKDSRTGWLRSSRTMVAPLLAYAPIAATIKGSVKRRVGRLLGYYCLIGDFTLRSSRLFTICPPAAPSFRNLDDLPSPTPSASGSASNSACVIYVHREEFSAPVQP